MASGQAVSVTEIFTRTRNPITTTTGRWGTTDPENLEFMAGTAGQCHKMNTVVHCAPPFAPSCKI